MKGSCAMHELKLNEDAETDNDYRKVQHEDPAGRGAVGDVNAPRLVMVARAVGWAGYLAVAVKKLAAVAEGEAVPLIGAEEVGALGFHEWDVGVRLGTHQAAVDRLKVIHPRIEHRILLCVDGLQPREIAVTEERVVAKVEFRLRHV